MGGFSGGIGGMATAVEQLKNREQVAALRRFMSAGAPSVVEVMLHQRDRHMVKELRRKCPDGTVVAVVGLAHMDGIEHEWHMQDALAHSRRDAALPRAAGSSSGGGGRG